MPFAEHTLFEQPDDKNIKLWRYMDFTQLISLCDTSDLFFARSDKLGDPFEGSWPSRNIEARKIVPHDIAKDKRAHYLSTMQMRTQLSQNWRKLNAINCWHMNEHESAAMCKLYLKTEEGIAIQSTLSRFRDSFVDLREIFIGIVRYIDYENDSIQDANNIYSPFLYKRKSFEHERELRAIVTEWPKKERNSMNFEIPTIGNGLRISVDLATLIERIYVSPTAPSWFFDLVKSVTHRYDFYVDVEQSKLNEQPLF